MLSSLLRNKTKQSHFSFSSCLPIIHINFICVYFWFSEIFTTFWRLCHNDILSINRFATRNDIFPSSANFIRQISGCVTCTLFLGEKVVKLICSSLMTTMVVVIIPPWELPLCSKYWKERENYSLKNSELSSKTTKFFRLFLWTGMKGNSFEKGRQ